MTWKEFKGLVNKIDADDDAEAVVYIEDIDDYKPVLGVELNDSDNTGYEKVVEIVIS